MIKKITKLATVLLVAVSLGTYAQTFVETNSLTGFNSSIAGLNNSKIAVADVNGDGKQDLIVAGRGPLFPTFTYLYTNSGTNFNLVPNTPFAEGANGVVLFADVNNDGRPDVFISGEKYVSSSENVGNLYINNGGSFTLSSNTFPGVVNNAAQFADVNGDSFLDILIIGEYTNGGNNPIAILYTSNGTNFTEVSGTPFMAVSNGFIKFADVNNDGKQDVLIGGRNSSNVGSTRLYTNSGSNFEEVMGTPFGTITGFDGAVFDANADGALDILISGYVGSNNVTKIYTNSGTNFGEAYSNFAQLFGNITVSDLDNNSYQDVLLYGTDDSFTSSILLYTNSGTSFGQVQGINFDFPSANAIIADINNDGKKDVIIPTTDISGSLQIVKFYLNTKSTEIITQPQSATVCSGIVQAFTVSATGTGLSYIWSNGATTSSINTILAGNYQVTVSGVDGKVVSSVATLSVTPSTQIITQPLATAAICSGNTQSFSVSASGVNLSYVWSNGVTGNSITTSIAGAYLVSVSGTCGTMASTAATLTISPTTAIITQPQSATVCSGIVQNFSVSAVGANLTYIWSNGISTNSFNTSVGNNFVVTVSGSCGAKVVSSVAILSVTPNTQITLQPASQTLCNGGGALFSVTGLGSSVSYLWSNGATAPVISTSVAGTYLATVSGTCGKVVSSAAQLTSATPTTITGITQGTAVVPGSTTNISVTATGTQLQYIWNTEATTPSLNGVSAGEYKVTVSGLCGSVVSESVRIGNYLFGLTTSGYTPVTTFGSQGSASNQLFYANSIAIGSDGKIYVVDHRNSRVSVWTQSGTTFTPLTTFGSLGSANNQFSRPRDIQIGSDGKIFITDTYNYRVSVWTQNGNTYSHLINFGSKGTAANQFDLPHGITTSSDGKVYITEEINNRVSVWTQNGNSFSHLTNFGSEGSAANQFSAPDDVAVGNDGKVFVADYYNNRVSVWTQNGNTYSHLTNFGSEGSAANQFFGPYRINIADGNKIHVSDFDNHRVSVWTQSGNNFGNLTSFGSYGSGNMNFNGTNGIVIKDKNIYVADFFNSRISVWKLPAPIFYLRAIFDIAAPKTFTGNTATLTWPTVTGAVNYCIRISKSGDFTSNDVKLVCDITGNSYTYNPNNPNGRTEAGLEDYYFQVLGVDNEGNESQWSETQTFKLDAGTTGLNSPLINSNYQIYPNPNSGSFVIETNRVEKYTISSIDGKILQTGNLAIGKNSIEINLHKGIYFVNVGGNVKKLMLE